MIAEELDFIIHGKFNCEILTYYHRQRNILYKPHGHRFYEIFYVESGSATHIYNKERGSIKIGDLVFIRPGDTHQYINPSDNFAIYNIVFTSKIANNLLSVGGSKSKAIFLDPKNPILVSIGKDKSLELLKLFDRSIESSDSFSKSFKSLSLLTYLLNSFIPERRDQEYPIWFSDLLELTSKDKNYTKGVSFLYSAATRSREHVSRSFKKYMNISPTDYINSLKLDYSANLLKFTNIEIIDIGEMVGFNSHSHFYHLFKERYATTPRLYRKQSKIL